MNRRHLLLVAVGLSLILPAPVPAPGQDGGVGAGAGGDAGGGVPPPTAPPAPPPQDLRFFPKDLDDALKALADPAADDEDRFDAMAKIARMGHLDGAADPLRKEAFGPVLGRSLEARQDCFPEEAGPFLAALDGDRLAAELRKEVRAAGDPRRLRNATFLAEGLGAPRGVEILAGPLAGCPAAEVRARAIEALGLLRAEKGIPIAEGMMGDADPGVRNAAALALGHIGSPRGAGSLLAGLGNTDGGTAWFSAEALGMIEDPGLFDTVLGRPAGARTAGPRARALENCARLANVDALVVMVQKGAALETRTAAANALGRLVGDEPAASESLLPAQREAVADALLEGIASEKEPTVRAACLWALRKCAVESTGAKVFRRLQTVQGDDRILFFLTLLGERRVAEAAPLLLRNGILASRQAMIRRAAGVAFWQISEPEAVKEFREKILGTGDAATLERLCDALGSWRSKEGFDTAVQLLRTTRPGSDEQFAVMLALEKMTGHYFDPTPATWNKWFERNPHFFSGKQERLERERWREEFDKENKGFRQTKETEKSVQMGLAWLARHQGFDGVWDGMGFFDHCDARDPCSKQGGERTKFSTAGMTGLPCLAFTGAGYSPDAGKHRHTLRRGLDSILAAMTVDGDFDQPDYIWNRSYARPICLQALSEGYGVSGDPRYRRGAERILAREFALMNETGGWRYALARGGPELDSSVTAWTVFALKAADKAGLKVPRLLWEGPYLAFYLVADRVPRSGPFEELIKDAGDYGTEVGKGKEHYLFQGGYTGKNDGPTRSGTPLALMSRIFLGWRRTHPFCIGAANFIRKHYLAEFDVFGEPGKEDWSRSGRFTMKALWGIYNLYYCTLAMHQMGGKYFYDWNRRVSRFLPRVQKKAGCERGSWLGWNRGDGEVTWIYTTSLGVLTMETYYRYAPILAD